MIVYLKFSFALIIALIISFIGTPFFIAFVQKKNGGQSIREEGPQSHYEKSGTPTMGGIAIGFAVLVALISVGSINGDMLAILGAFFGFGILGFADDFIKISKQRNLGLTAKQKILIQLLLASLLALYQWKNSPMGTELIIPFSSKTLDLGMFYTPFVIFVVVAMVNSVNLTDGLDGLASGITTFVAFFFALAAISLKIYAPGIFSAALMGACLGFLRYNKNPAKVFMGDTGSMALGGALAATAIILNMELFLPLVGGIFVIEALSVILQVAYFKITKGKRLFKMSPIHHHFELSGWTEPQVVSGFWGVTFILCAIGFLGL